MSSVIKEDDFLASLRKQCEAYKIDFEEAKTLYSDVVALVGKGLETDVSIAVQRASSDIDKSMNYWESIFYLPTQASSLGHQEKSLLNLFSYLLLAEGIFGGIVQIITFLLVKNDHDIYDYRRNEFVTSYEELEEVDLSLKLKFLKKHGFALLVASIDKKLRNNIAHLNFVVKTDGSIIDKKTNSQITDLEQRMNRLGKACSLTLGIIDYLLKIRK
jgi:hypothetical protein